jgi:glutamate decarboxylase
VRNGFTHDLADEFMRDLRNCLPLLQRQPAPLRGSTSASFSHGLPVRADAVPQEARR